MISMNENGTEGYHLNYGLVIGLISAVVINRLTALLHRLRVIYPKAVLADPRDYYLWRYRNFLISFCHAFLTGVGSLLCVINTPTLLFDVLDTYNEFGYWLTSFSFGYFLYDTVEMITHAEYKGTTELVIHHILILLCFSNTILNHRYVGYNMVALLIENSNIFLHFRQLLLLSSYPRSGPYFQVNSVINIVNFVLIRGSCMFWLWYTLLINLNVIPWITKAIALTAMTGISITTVILFKRVFKSDFEFDSNGRIQRRLVPLKSAKLDRDESIKQSPMNGKSKQEYDLYEPMPSAKAVVDDVQDGLRMRISNISLPADQMAATSVAAVAQ
ncbi:hypothetical protein RDWZM_007481 [Blomia tropicalis]|uniref:TLC domain-containing protein n=1 Tax=Blomia tropicalis TaxID=40697 RepID=A0A9Q0RJ27_BLOTA|nr:hypothetical protein RDWZM_007481 [Blomia tropicalis]